MPSRVLKKRLFQLTNRPLQDNKKEKPKTRPTCLQCLKQIREHLTKLVQTLNGDEAAGQNSSYGHSIHPIQLMLSHCSVGCINAKQSTNCWAIFTTEVSTEGMSYGYCC
jgi:hypothetical protein